RHAARLAQRRQRAGRRSRHAAHRPRRRAVLRRRHGLRGAPEPCGRLPASGARGVRRAQRTGRAPPGPARVPAGEALTVYGSNAKRGGVGGVAPTPLTINRRVASIPLTLMARALLLATLLMGTVWWVPDAISQDEPVTTDKIGDQVQTRRGGVLPKFSETG